ncbi:hypothetical protein ACHQM5_028485 [Ranunculus cassubicifolius]
MANTSSFEIELVDSDRGLEDCSLNEFDTIEEFDDTCGTQVIANTTSEISVIPSEPYIGMEFKSADNAREYYEAYGRCNGFTIRVNRKRRSRVDREVIGFDYVCSKEGFRRKRHSREVKVRAKQTRTGCKAILVIAYRRDMEKWVVTNFLREHNHELMIPSEVPIKSEKGVLNEDEKDRRIRELTTKLYNERARFQRQCAAYEERCATYKLQINTILKDIEEHNYHLSRKVDNVVQSIKQFEDEDLHQKNDMAKQSPKC